MRNLFQPEAVQEVMDRIEELKPTSQRQWVRIPDHRDQGFRAIVITIPG